jgi:PAS domain S-box-containing protein
MSEERCRVLVIDDDEDDFVLTRDVLSDIKSPVCEAHWARTFDDGLSRLKSARFDIALVDFRLGARDGLELIELAQSAGVSVPMIVLTGKGSDEVDAAGASRGAADFLTKRDLTAPLLARAIRYALAHARREANFRALIEQSPDAIFVHRSGTIAYANPAAIDYLGISNPAAIVGRSMFELYDEVDRADAEASAARVRAGRGGQSREARFVRSDGARLVASVVDHALVFDDHLAILSTARDVTAIRRLQSRLALNDRMAAVGTLAAGVAHEINNPLTYVMADIELARRTLADAGALDAEKLTKIRSVLADAAEGADRVRCIVRDLRTFAHGDEEASAAIDLRESIDAALALTRPKVEGHARVVKEYGAIPRVLANEARACQIFVALLLNAARALDGVDAERATITIRTREDETGAAVVDVEDTGAGMTKEVLARAFEPFFTTRDVGGGMGLGLSICHGLVTSMNGRIHITSEVGTGTCVTIAIPAATVP